MAAERKPVAAATIQVLGTTLTLKEEKKLPKQYLGEYISSEESFDNFTKMFAIWGRLDGQDAITQVKAKVQFVNARKGTDPVANYKLFIGDDKKSYGLDFMISEGGVIEHNVWNYTNINSGVLSYQFVRRHYEGKSAQSAQDFIKSAPQVGSEVLTFFKTGSLPKPEGYEK